VCGQNISVVQLIVERAAVLLLLLLRVDIFSDCCSMHIQPISMLIGSLCRLFRGALW